jgi:acetyltransferase-like isoleucine patch superfamily enzyme
MYRRLMIALCVKKNVVFSPDLHVSRGSLIMAPNRLAIGKKVIIGMNAWIAVDGSIGDGVLMSSYVGIVGRRDHDHRAVGKLMTEAPWVHGDGDWQAKAEKVVIEDDVWIGFGALILSGVTIGRGAVVAAGSLVTKDVRSYDIVAGRPAQTVGRRFSDNEIVEHERLLKLNQ